MCQPAFELMTDQSQQCKWTNPPDSPPAISPIQCLSPSLEGDYRKVQKPGGFE